MWPQRMHVSVNVSRTSEESVLCPVLAGGLGPSAGPRLWIVVLGPRYPDPPHTCLPGPSRQVHRAAVLVGSSSQPLSPRDRCCGSPAASPPWGSLASLVCGPLLSVGSGMFPGIVLPGRGCSCSSPPPPDCSSPHVRPAASHCFSVPGFPHLCFVFCSGIF